MSSEKIRKFGLIGYPLSHSFSPGYFKEKFALQNIVDASYHLYPIESIDLLDEIEGVKGLNVTIPYKELVIPFLDELSTQAQSVGAVNTIQFVGNKKIGHNTDVVGFERSLLPLLERKNVNQALILGSGGAAKAICYVLGKLSIPYLIVSRKAGDLKYDEIDEEIIRKCSLIINTTPLGMYPEIDKCPDIPYDFLNEEHILYDLIYNPEKTLFLKRGADQDCTVKNGLEMLQIQADESWKIWNSMKN